MTHDLRQARTPRDPRRIPGPDDPRPAPNPADASRAAATRDRRLAGPAIVPGASQDFRPLRPTLVLLLAAALSLMALPLAAQQLSLDLGTGDTLNLRTVQLLVLLTLLSLAPGLAIMVTCFPFMVTVLSILRQAIGVQQAPPNMMIVSLALFLTWFVMEPVFRDAWDLGVRPMIDGAITPEAAFPLVMAPFRGFMEGRVDPATVTMLVDAAPPRADVAPGGATPLSVLVPAFLLSEIKRGFEVGFLIFLPFLVIDLVIAAVLMSMGMMMVPPAIVSLPFKLAFFVIADGWTLLAGALVRSYGT